jgi:cystathionine beta-lyase
LKQFCLLINSSIEKLKFMKFNTKTIHGGQKHDPAYGSVMPPIYQTSTYAQSTPGGHKGYEYSRTHNPTRNALENAFASIENGNYGLAFGSGLAAIDAVIKLLEPGDEVISTNDLYGGSYRLFTSIFKKFGIKFHFIGMENASNIENYINAQTKLIWVETPTNPMMKIIDVKATSAIAKKHKIWLAVDNTFATPYLQRPLDLGADIVMHSATKYLGGHSDLVMGALIVKDKDLANRLYFIQNASGAVCGPQDSFLALRGIKTLHLRMQRHCENGRAVAEFLAHHPKIENVYWPGFESHPNHAIAKEQMDDFGGMVSFTTKGNNYDEAIKIVEHLKLFTLAESLGGVESLAGHPASMTHASIPKEEREKTGLVDSLIRLSVGIEDEDDLIADLKQAIG